MGLFKKSGIVADVIRCDEKDYLIWKWHPQGTERGNNKRENAIRWGSSLRVKDGSVAIFVYKQKNGLFQDYIEGPFDDCIHTKNFPVLSGIVGLSYDGNSPFQAEVYFINLARIIQIKFAIPYFDVYDYRFEDFGVPVAVRGTISFRITDYKEFIKLHRLDEFTLDDFNNQINDAVTKYVKNVISNISFKNELSVIQLDRNLDLINHLINIDVSDRLSKDFGVTVLELDAAFIDIDKTSTGYEQLKAITQDITYAKQIAKAEADIKNIHDYQRINIKDYEDTLRIQREEGAYAQHKQTQSANLGAFQAQKQAEVGVAGAEALGKMGSNGAGNVNIGSGDGTGFNPASMMASIALGGVVANNMAGTMKDAMQGINASGNGANPPTIPETVYNVAVDGIATGPYNISSLTKMAQSGQLSGDSLVWKPGMENWAKLETIDELKSLLNSIPPIPPKQD